MTDSKDGAYNIEFVIHYEGTMDVAQPVPSSPGMDRNPFTTLESSVVLEQEPVNEDTSGVVYATPRDSVE